MIRKILPLLLIIGCIGIAAGRPAHALVLHFDPASVTVGVGSSFSVDLLADVASTEAIIGWDLSAAIGDPSLVAVSSWTVGSLWDPVLSVVPDGGAGLSLTPQFGSNVLLATLNLRCLGEGTTSLGPALLDDFQGFMLADGVTLMRDFQPDFVTITQTPATVPEPGTMLLLGTGLAGFAGWRRRKQAR